MQNQTRNNNKVVIITILVVIGMFGFAFASVPLYNFICDVTGLTGKTNETPYQVSNNESHDSLIDTSRLVTVQFITINNDNMPWEFHAPVDSVKVHPGEFKEISFFAKNPTKRTITGQAIPSVTPFNGAKYFLKVECFCFNSQVLHAGEQIDMPLRFVIDKDLPKDVNTITLLYTMHDITQLVSTN